MEVLKSDTPHAAYEGLEATTENIISQQFDRLPSSDTFQAFNALDTHQYHDILSDVDKAVILEGAVMNSWLRTTKVVDAMVTLRTNQSIDSADDRIYIAGQILNEADNMLIEHGHQSQLIEKQILECSAWLDSTDDTYAAAKLNVDIQNLQASYNINQEKCELLKKFKSDAREDPYQYLLSVERAMAEVQSQVKAIVDEIKVNKIRTAELEQVAKGKEETVPMQSKEKDDTVPVVALDDPTKLALGVVKKMLVEK